MLATARRESLLETDGIQVQDKVDSARKRGGVANVTINVKSVKQHKFP